MNAKSIWSRIVETAVCQIRSGWLLVPITIGLTITILRVGLLASCLVALALTGALWGRKYRITVRDKEDN